MSTENTDISMTQKIINIILLVLMILALSWINYQYFSKHISSNPERINNFIVVDAVNKFQIPVTAAFFYPYNAKGQKILASEINPRILVVPYSGYLYSQKNVAKAYSRLLPWKQKIRNVILVGQSLSPDDDKIYLNKEADVGSRKDKLLINQNIVRNWQQNSKIQFAFADLNKELSVSRQIPLIKDTFATGISFVPLAIGKQKMAEILPLLQPYLYDDKSLVIFSADMSGYYTEEADSADKNSIDLIIKLAQAAHLYPKVFDLVNFEDIAEQNYRLTEQPATQKLSTLEQENENLISFARLYGMDLLKIAKVSLDEAVVHHKHFKPERENYEDVLFNRGAAFVNLYKGEELRGSSGTLLPNQAIAFTVAQNAYDAALSDKDYASVQASELADIKIKINLITGFERVEYKNEKDLLQKLRPNVDGIVLRDGNRQGVFLPMQWKKYPQAEEFLNNLKIKAGLSPAYWSNRIKIYRFRAVEISRHEN